jgi:hypothetical protein
VEKWSIAADLSAAVATQMDLMGQDLGAALEATLYVGFMLAVPWVVLRLARALYNLIGTLTH